MKIKNRKILVSKDFELEDLGCTVDGLARVRVSLGRRSVILREMRVGTIEIDYGSRAHGGRRRTGTRDLQAAVEYAESKLRELAQAEWAGQQLTDSLVATRGDISWAACFALFLRDRIGAVSEKYASTLRLIMDIIENEYGLEQSVLAVDSTWVADFIHRRTKRGIRFSPRFGRRDLRPCDLVTAVSNLNDLATIVQHACDLPHPLDRTRPLLAYNPLTRPSVRKAIPPVEKRLRPVSEFSIFRELMTPGRTSDGVPTPPPVERTDPTGKGVLRCILATLVYHGRRERAVLNLRRGDLCLTIDEVRAKLREVGGVHDPTWADHFVYGAIHYRPEFDKNGYDRLCPMSAAHRAEIDHYLDRSGLREAPPDTPLFPSYRDCRVPISPSTLYSQRYERTKVDRRTGRRIATGHVEKGGWYTEAVHLAREEIADRGEDPDTVVPLEVAFSRHGWRRWFANHLERLGYGRKTVTVGDNRLDLDRHVSFLGSWTILGGGIKQERYVRLDPRILMAAISFEPAKVVLDRIAAEADSETAEGIADVLASIVPDGAARDTVGD